MLTEKEKRLLLDLAEEAVRAVITGMDRPSPETELPEVLQEKRGIFVSLYHGDTLRGCMGTVLGILPLWQACMEYARSAAIKDVRFAAVRREELQDVSIEIAVTGPARPIHDPSVLLPGRDGLLLKKGFRREAFLPGSIANVIKEGGSLFDQLKLKAGIDPQDDTTDEWDLFEAEVFSDIR